MGDDDDEHVRSILGRLLFSRNEINKSVKVIPGGEKGRLLFDRIMIQTPNIILMDDPTNHLIMESIESLNSALEHDPGTVFFVSYDREFVSSLATCVIEMTADGLVNFRGNYEEKSGRWGRAS